LPIPTLRRHTASEATQTNSTSANPP
jgi:hypothetical protein